MSYTIFCDESGETSFSLTTNFQYFLICSMTIDSSLRKKIKGILKHKYARLYALGWPKQLEIKANILHSCINEPIIPKSLKNVINGDDYIKIILKQLTEIIKPQIDYIVINKEGITNPQFRNAPYGIAYNYFAGKLLLPLIADKKDCLLIVDKRNKEVHNQKHFDGYIDTCINGYAMENNLEVKIKIEHGDSKLNYGLQAVDYFSWGIYRKYNMKDTQYLEIFNRLIKNGQEWYCPK